MAYWRKEKRRHEGAVGLAVGGGGENRTARFLRVKHQSAIDTFVLTTILTANTSAIEFCARKAKSVHAVSETASTPPHILGNFPRIELIFQCVDTSTNPSTVSEGNKYDKIAALKKLLDSGALTQQEFDAEKAKVLATP